MNARSRSRDLVPVRHLLGWALLALTILFGCSDDDPTGPQPSSGSWQDIGPSGTFVEVRDLISWNGVLVAGGSFNDVQGHPFADLLTWDGATWSVLDKPLGGVVRALVVYDGDLIVGCGLQQASSDTLPKVASWDGVQWTPLGSELNHGSVTALGLYEGDLIAGFTPVAPGDTVSYVVRWNGTSWQPIGGALNGGVGAFAEYQGLLVAGGGFDLVDGVTARGIAAWNGTAWTSVGGGVGGGAYSPGVSALMIDGTTLVAGGHFETAGGVPAVNIARWNGAEWSPLGAGLGHPTITVYVWALAKLGDALVAGGVLAPNPVVRWTGSEWTPMSSLYAVVFTFTTHDGSLIAGGFIPASGGQQGNGVVKWIP